MSGLLTSAANYANANPDTLAPENEATESPDASPSFLEGMELFSEAGALGLPLQSQHHRRRRPEPARP